MKSETSDFRNYACIYNGVHQYGRLYGRLYGGLYGRLRVEVPEELSVSTFTTEDGGNRLSQIFGLHMREQLAPRVISHVREQFYEHTVKSTRNACLGVTIISCRPTYKNILIILKL